jgi:chorismate synthase
MCIHAVKAVEIGIGVEVSRLTGSHVHDEIGYNELARKFIRPTNRAGGIEGGITNGEEVSVRGHLKPISTLRQPLASVDVVTKEESAAAFERSDIVAVPAAGVIGEAMVAIVLAGAVREKFGGDSLGEMKRNFRDTSSSSNGIRDAVADGRASETFLRFCHEGKVAMTTDRDPGPGKQLGEVDREIEDCAVR